MLTHHFSTYVVEAGSVGLGHHPPRGRLEVAAHPDLGAAAVRDREEVLEAELREIQQVDPRAAVEEVGAGHRGSHVHRAKVELQEEDEKRRKETPYVSIYG